MEHVSWCTQPPGNPAPAASCHGELYTRVKLLFKTKVKDKASPKSTRLFVVVYVVVNTVVKVKRVFPFYSHVGTCKQDTETPLLVLTDTANSYSQAQRKCWFVPLEIKLLWGHLELLNGAEQAEDTNSF